jgi:hypothetical protein
MVLNHFAEPSLSIGAWDIDGEYWEPRTFASRAFGASSLGLGVTRETGEKLRVCLMRRVALESPKPISFNICYSMRRG